MSEEIINLKDYFIHYYDDWGRPYCVEFKGSPLELENSIKRLQEENMGMKKSFVDIISNIREENYRYYKALKEVKAISDNYNLTVNDRREQIANKINEVLKDERA